MEVSASDKNSKNAAWKKPGILGLIGGRGQMGQVFAEVFEADGYEVLVAGRSTELTYEALVEQSDVVILTVPVEETPRVVERIAPVLRPQQLLSDFTSIKVAPMAAMAKTRACVIGCHPVFGPTARPEGQNVVLCPERPGGYLPWYTELFTRGGMNVSVMTAEAHDEAMGFVQGLTHFVNLAFGATLSQRKADIQALLGVSSPVYRVFFSMLGRIFSGEAELYGQIQTNNPKGVAVVEDFLKIAQDLKEKVANGDREAIYAMFSQAADFLGEAKNSAKEDSDLLIEQLRIHQKEEG